MVYYSEQLVAFQIIVYVFWRTWYEQLAAFQIIVYFSKRVMYGSEQVAIIDVIAYFSLGNGVLLWR